MPTIDQLRGFLKSNFGDHATWKPSDQDQGVPPPPHQLPVPADAKVIELPKPDRSVLKKSGVWECIGERCSRRNFLGQPLTLAELSFLLWATQGVKKTGPAYSLRTVPSAGARHPFETYLAVRNVESLEEGLYRYQPLNHKLVALPPVEHLRRDLVFGTQDQEFVGRAAVVFLWACVPYRGEWRYGAHAHKPMLLDAGHLCQNLYLACEAIGCGTCAIAAYDQQKLDALLRIDGHDEFVVYLAPVGHVA
jgi:SagB-type dehydrogenase family enzyme